MNKSRKNNSNGNLIISLDFELLWGLAGWSDQQKFDYLPNIFGAKEALSQILKLADEYNIKITIAYVGGMMYKDYEDFLKHSPINKPSYSNKQFSSYFNIIDFAKANGLSEYLFCKDLLLELNNKKNIELGSHTFSHYYCLEKGQNNIQFKDDIQTARIEANRNNIKLSSIILPRNQVSQEYLDIIKNTGYTHYRGNFEDSFLYKAVPTKSKYTLRGLLKFLDTYIPISGSNSYTLEESKSPFNVRGSMFFRPYSSSLKIFEKLKMRRIKKAMKDAALKNEIFHLWWHPHNFGTFTKENIKNFQEICKFYKILNEKYNFESKFMKEIK